MCGYTYYFNTELKKKINKKILRDTLNLQRHRGPDISRWSNYKNSYFFHNRLKVIDLSNRANQPMTDTEGNIILFNGEIYNYLDLKKKYNLKNLKTNSDTEVILSLYKKLGENFVNKLNGIFSFLIFNKKKNQLFVARDRFGVKPLFYYLDKEKIIFSTEIKPILKLLKTYNINLKVISEYISTGKYFHTNSTFFEKIKIFPVSSFKIIDIKKNKVVRSKKYWKLIKKKKYVCKNYKQFYEKFLKNFEKALKYNFVSDVKLSLLLSSGNDSVFIHDFIKKKTLNELSCFTYGWKDNKYNEIKRLNQINLNIKKQHNYIIQPRKIFNNLKSLIHKFEGPVGGFGTLAQYYLFKNIRSKKIKVAFSGEGADEFLLGYKNFSIIQNNEKNKKSFFSDTIHSPDGIELNDNNLINKNYSKKNTIKKFKNLNEVLINYLFKVKLPKLLIFYDKASALNGIEGRVPMLDHNLAEFLFSNSSNYRIQKRPIKDYLEFNKINFYKNKLNVSTPQREFFKKKDILNKVIGLIKNGYLQKLKMINLKNFEKKYKNFLTEKKNSNSFFIWKVLNVEYFLQVYGNQSKKIN